MSRFARAAAIVVALAACKPDLIFSIEVQDVTPETKPLEAAILGARSEVAACYAEDDVESSMSIPLEVNANGVATPVLKLSLPNPRSDCVERVLTKIAYPPGADHRRVQIAIINASKRQRDEGYGVHGWPAPLR